MSCTTYEEMIALDAGGDLAAADAGRLEAHLRSCDACRRFAAEMRESQRAVGMLASVPVDDVALAAVRAGVRREIERSARRWPAILLPFEVPQRRLALAAGLLAALAAALLLRSGWQQQPGTQQADPPQVVSQPTVPRPPAPTAPAAPEAVAPAMPEPAAGTPSPIRPPRMARLEPPVPESPTLPPATAPTSVPALAAAPPPAESMVIKLVSEEADLVIYWLVNPPTETTKENKHVSAV